MKPQPSPRVEMYLASSLELCMFGIFVAERSLLGVVLWLLYLWFSATWALFCSFFR
jgi:hypothetical protein